MIALMPDPSIAASITGHAAAMVSSTVQSTSMKIANTTALDAKKTGNWLTKFIKNNAQWLQRNTQWLSKFSRQTQQYYAKFAQKILQFNNFIMTMMRFMPVIKVFIAIILIFSNLLQYVIMAIAWLAIAIIEVGYKIISLPPLIYLVFLVYFIIVDVVPFLMYTVVFLALLVIITVLCIFLAFIDSCTGGHLKILILCQNSPAAWYKTPAHHLYNSYSRGLLCSKPCLKGYYPDTTGTSCVRLPSATPPYCPQAQVMRLYSGDGKNDKHTMYKKYRTKANYKYLLKTPSDREAILLDDFTKRQEHYDKCSNKKNVVGMSKHDRITRNVCANLDALKKSGKLHGMSESEIEKLEQVCHESFCNSKSSYPFCSSLSDISEANFADIIRKIIMTIISIIMYSVTLMLILAYMNSTE